MEKKFLERFDLLRRVIFFRTRVMSVDVVPYVMMADMSLVQADQVPQLRGRRYLGKFNKPLLDQVENDALYIVVRDDDNEDSGPLIREARLINVYPNCNTGWPSYQFEYTRVLRGNPSPHAMPFVIGRNEYYSLYQ